ncbi:N-acetyltransferase [Parvibaculum sp.]|uniref:GNAT family N-acetyltransferase n=1 Tax=Parvibaculum sp. TaxID=2024848 RepID=UPI001B11BF0C|nr:N-acetyltransferase [Parvibaculum sp.]MBO6678719.1 GNAT family N-acetyltransferase [Parvibaculum sp.]MBO6685678.1 GNAT family N-acetyltransferase [Parvibaculum sp.]
MFEHLFDDAYPGLTAKDALALGVGDETSPYHFENAYLVETESGVVGCLIAFPADDLGLPEIVYSILPKDRIDPARPLFERQLPDSFYINTLAVDEAVRGRGVGSLLLDFASELARSSGCDSLTLHAWGDNDAALSLYRAYGFQELERIELPKSAALTHGAPMLLLKCPLA